MDNHPSCRRLHKIPAHTVKELGSRPQRLPPCAPTFPSLRAAHYSWLFRFVNTLFRAVAPKWTLLPMLLRRWPREAFVVASRLLCQAFRFRQHLLSKQLKSSSVAAAALRWPLRRGRESMSLSGSFVKGVDDIFSRRPPSVHDWAAQNTAQPMSCLACDQKDAGKIALADLQQAFETGDEHLLGVLHHLAVHLYRTLLELA